MQRNNRVAVVTLAVAIGLGACSASTDESGGSGDSGQVDLEWSFWTQSEQADASWKALATQVTKENPNITVELSQVPFADYFTKYQSQLAAGEAACIIGMQSLRLPAFAETMAPIGDGLAASGFDESEWNPGALRALQYEDEQYAVPFGFSTMQMYYNKDLFAQAGVEEPTDGWTIEDFEATAKQITKATGTPAFGQSFSDLHMFALLYAYNGATPVTSDGELDLTNEKMQEAFAWYTSLSTQLDVASTPSSSSDIPWGEQEFVAGNVAMAVDGTWNTVSNATSAPFQVGVVTLPVGSAGGGTYSANSGFGVSATCEHKDEAVEAITVLTNAESAEASAQAGQEPARLAASDIYYDGIAETVSPEYAEQAHATSEASSANAVPFISTDNWDQVTKEIARQFILAYTGDTAPEAVLETTQQAAGR